MIVNQKVIKFLDDNKKYFVDFYKKNPCVKRFISPSENDGKVIERIMRLGIEARALEATTEEEFIQIAIVTLHRDYLTGYKNEE